MINETKIPFNFKDNYWQYLNSLPNEFFIKVLSNIHLGIIVWGADGSVLYINPAVRRYFDVEPLWMNQYFNGEAVQVKSLPFFKNIEVPIVIPLSAEMNNEAKQRILTPVFLDEKRKSLKFVIELFQETFKHFDVDISEDLSFSNKKKNKDNIIGRSLSFLKPLVELKKIALSNMPILLLGKSGVGKTLIANYIHDYSPRKEEQFISVNCGAIPDNLLEAELFGYEAGAFTGAHKDGKEGLFGIANQGTIFLDEIGDMPLPLQVKILQVIENKTYIPVGGRKIIETDVRIITATNKDLKELIEQKLFRADLYWRISTFYQTIPPLRERKEDIISLAHFYLNALNEKYDTHKIFDFSTLYLLLDYHWPGNVRELKHTIEKMYILNPNSIISFSDFKLTHKEKTMTKTSEYDFGFIVNEIKRVLVQKSYHKNKTTVKVAEDLKISQSKAYRLVQKYCKKN